MGMGRRQTWGHEPQGGGGLFIGEKGVLYHGAHSKAVMAVVDSSSSEVAARQWR
jgi:hypothetical protein